MEKKNDDILVLDDRHEWFSYGSDCARCKHYANSYSCAAFPDGIPLDILSGDKTHRKVLQNQTGITVYTKK